MTRALPAVVCATNPHPGSIVKVEVSQQCRVTYKFDTRATSATLKIPYAVEVDGEVPCEYDEKASLAESGRISVMVKVGATVALYLNSDAHPAYRREAVYKVTTTRNNVVVNIIEKTGLEPGSDVLGNHEKGTENGRDIDIYTAPLTGAIWMRVSHRYSVAEAKALLPEGTHPVICEVVEAIYGGLSSRKLDVALPASGANTSCKCQICFEDSNNAHSNIKGFSLTQDGLPRVHPRAFVVLLDAIHACGLERVVVGSTWRPMLGAINHRAGLGLDISSFKCKTAEVLVNREELILSNGRHMGNVSEREKQLYRDYLDAAKSSVEADKAKNVADSLVRANKDPSLAVELAKRQATATTVALDATTRSNRKKQLWVDEANRNEPPEMRSLRSRLQRSSLLTQIMDPWCTDSDTRDGIKAALNFFKSRDEIIHKDHLHLTILEPKIL